MSKDNSSFDKVWSVTLTTVDKSNQSIPESDPSKRTSKRPTTVPSRNEANSASRCH